jgi:hypothetical protein
MKSVPKIVRERLRASLPDGVHPEANRLAAFSERALSERERSDVLQHLARCAECRDVVALALPEIEASQLGASRARSVWITWPAFRWAFVTAGVAILAIGALRYEARNRPAAQAALDAKLVPRPESETTKPAPSVPAQTTPAARQEKLLSSNMEQRPASEPRRLKAESPDSSAREMSGASGKTPAANRAPMTGQAPNQSAALPPSASKKQAEDIATRFDNFAVPQLMKKNGPSPLAETQLAQAAPQPFDRSALRAIGKAKAAAITELGGQSASPRWTITATGGLQRSFDQGHTWQDVDVNAAAAPAVAANFRYSVRAAGANDKPALQKSPKSAGEIVFRAVAANGSEVWAGGSSGMLFHSTDAGNQWTRVIPSSAGMVLSTDIVGLDFPTPQSGTITTSTGEVWTTSDGGQSWQKQ